MSCHRYMSQTPNKSGARIDRRPRPEKRRVNVASTSHMSTESAMTNNQVPKPIRDGKNSTTPAPPTITSGPSAQKSAPIRLTRRPTAESPYLVRNAARAIETPGKDSTKKLEYQ